MCIAIEVILKTKSNKIDRFGEEDDDVVMASDCSPEQTCSSNGGGGSNYDESLGKKSENPTDDEISDSDCVPEFDDDNPANKTIVFAAMATGVRRWRQWPARQLLQLRQLKRPRRSI